MLTEMDPSGPCFAELEARLQRRLLDSAGASSTDCGVQWMGGSSRAAIVEWLRAVFPVRARLLVACNGPLARRAAAAARLLGLSVVEAALPEDAAIAAEEVESAASGAGPFDGLLAVHAEPSTGVLNPLAPLGRLAAGRGWRFIVDATLTFGAYPIDLGAFEIDALAACSGFSLESAPGLGILLTSNRREFKFLPGSTDDAPPVPLLLALDQALIELEQEGGIEGRAARYRDNHMALIRGMAGLGFTPWVRPESRSYLTTRFQPSSHFRPEVPLVELLSQRGYRIGAGPVVASLGRIYPSTIEAFLDTLRELMAESHAA